jgi:hypothetical protein
VNLRQVKKLIGIFIRVFIVAFVFIMDVKVRADVVKDQKINLDVDTLTSERSDGSYDFFRGKGFYNIHHSSITIHTAQGVVSSEGGEFIVEVEKNKTTLNVLTGEANFRDRASNKNVKVSGGYSYWLGGLLSTGSHANPLSLEAYDMDHTMTVLKNLSGWTEVEFDRRFADMKPLWKVAVNKVAEQTQSNLNKDIQTLNDIILAEKKLELKRKGERSKVHNLFRERALGESFPSQGNPRTPSNSPD